MNNWIDLLLDQDLNTTELFAPVVDTFIPPEDAFLGRDPQVALQKGDFQRVRVITGVAESEGVAMLSNYRNLFIHWPKQSAGSLHKAD